jgi:hypothetical protein
MRTEITLSTSAGKPIDFDSLGELQKHLRPLTETGETFTLTWSCACDGGLGRSPAGAICSDCKGTGRIEKTGLSLTDLREIVTPRRL